MGARIILVSLFCFALFAQFGAALAQAEVFAEALGTANLRAHDYLEAERVGEIAAGQRYPVIGRSARAPWLLLGDPLSGAPIGWVYRDLVRITGELNIVPFREQALHDLPATMTPAPEQSEPAAPGEVTGAVRGEINLRAGPGIEYPRVGVARAGERFTILATHSQFPWLRVASAGLPGGTAWVAEGLLDISGKLAELPRETRMLYATPALTATPVVVRAPAGSPPLTAEWQALGETLWTLFVDAGFDELTEPVGALFLYNLSDGTALQFGGNIAFSGTSLTKIGILLELFRRLEAPPNGQWARLMAHTMICSDNQATNDLLRFIGGGDALAGALAVTESLNALGISHSYISAPYAIPGEVTVPIPAFPIETDADQQRARPDPYNQATAPDIGRLLRGIYDCARDESGMLADVFPASLRARECRSMLAIMAENHVDSLLKSGAPAGITVAHKHGWIGDTHGNAALFFTPGGDYALVMILYKPPRLDFTNESLPLFAEVSRLVYNHINPQAPLPEARPGYIPPLSQCDFSNSDLLGQLQRADAPFPP